MRKFLQYLFFKSSDFGFKKVFFAVFGWYFTPWIRIRIQEAKILQIQRIRLLSTDKNYSSYCIWRRCKLHNCSLRCTIIHRTVVCTVQAEGASYVTVHCTVVQRTIVCTVQAAGASYVTVQRTIVCTVQAAGGSYITVYCTVVQRTIVCTVQAAGASYVTVHCTVVKKYSLYYSGHRSKLHNCKLQCTIIHRTIDCTVQAAGASYVTVHCTFVQSTVVCSV